MKNMMLLTAAATALTGSIAIAAPKGGENLMHKLKTQVYEINAEGDGCTLMLQYNSASSMGTTKPVVIRAKLYTEDVEILANTPVDKVEIVGNQVTFAKKLSIFRKSNIIVQVDDTGKPVRAKGEARDYAQTGKVTCKFK